MRPRWIPKVDWVSAGSRVTKTCGSNDPSGRLVPSKSTLPLTRPPAVNGTTRSVTLLSPTSIGIVALNVGVSGAGGRVGVGPGPVIRAAPFTPLRLAREIERAVSVRRRTHRVELRCVHIGIGNQLHVHGVRGRVEARGINS